MRPSATVLTLAASLSTSSATVYKGFNYGATDTSGAVKVQADFEAEFKAAKELVGASGFTSARLYTSVQSGGGPISAIPAAIAQDTSLLLGIWCSGGADEVTTEIAALKQAISEYGTDFTDLVIGLSIGSEDLYRNSPTGIAADAGVGTNPNTIVSYISQVRTALAGTALSDVSIGHVDTWTAWVNGSNSAVIDACDWIGVDAYPYFQGTVANGIENGKSLLLEAYDNTLAVSSNKPVWITETGWPVSGSTVGSGVPSLSNAKTYWDEVGCNFAFDKINTFWYTLVDSDPTTPNPSFGVVGYPDLNTPLYDLSCSNTSSSSTTPVTATGTATNAVSATISALLAGSTGSAGTGGGSGSSNGTYTATSLSTSATRSASTTKTTGLSSNAGSTVSGSALGRLAVALIALVVAL